MSERERERQRERGREREIHRQTDPLTAPPLSKRSALGLAGPVSVSCEWMK